MRHSLEDRVLITLAQKAAPDRIRAELQGLSKPFNWDHLIQRSVEEQVYPMVYRNISDAGEEQPSPKVLDQLRQLYEMNAIRVDIFRSELHSILKLFAAHHIEVIPLKGIALSESLYGDPYLRSSVDIDVLVKHASIAEAVRLLTTLGYSRLSSDTDLDFESNVRDLPLRKQIGSFVIHLELHWAIMWGSALDRPALQLLWDTSRSKNFLGTTVRYLNPEWELIFLAGHAARSPLSQLKAFVDVAERAEKSDIDWATFSRMSAITGWDRAVRWSLQSCQLLLGRPNSVVSTSRFAPQRINLYPTALSGPLINVADMNDPGLLDRPSSRLRFVLIALLTPRSSDRQWVRLPRFLHCLYYLVRPIRLALITLKRTCLHTCKFLYRVNSTKCPAD